MDGRAHRMGPIGSRRGRGGWRGVLGTTCLVAVWTIGGWAGAEDGVGLIGPPVPTIAVDTSIDTASEWGTESGSAAPTALAGAMLAAADTMVSGEAARDPNTESRPIIPAGVTTPSEGEPIGVVGSVGGSMVPEASGLGSTVVSVSGVVALIVVVACVAKMARRGSGGGLNTSRAPSGILEVLGRYPMAGGPTLMLLRVDRRVLLLSQARASRLSGATLSTLAEFEDVDQVASLLAQARDARDESISARFGSLLAGFSAEHGGKQSEFETGRADVVEVEQDQEVNDAGAWPLRAAATAHRTAATPGAGDGAAMLRRRLDGMRQWEGATA